MRLDPGAVALVGAGPGSADLLTVRAVRMIASAEAVLYDALVADDVLALAPSACLRIQTGKRSGKTSMKQATINRLMLRLARRGLRVVRLKGGDPSIFGRSGEERAFLEQQGVPVVVVPGVTAASAAAAQFAFPLTHRGEARRITFATVRVEDGASVDGGLIGGGWSALADAQTTVALYMARDSIQTAAARLVAAGRSPATPVIAIENAGRPQARAIPGLLSTIGARLAAQSMDGPVVIIVGEVAAQARLCETERAAGQPEIEAPRPRMTTP